MFAQTIKYWSSHSKNSIEMKFLAIIPARYASTRFPAKPLVLLDGKPIIQHVYERVAQCVEHTYVATDDERIFNAVKGFGGNVVMTKSEHRCGTDRCCEAMENLGLDIDIVINVQGDEPFMEPDVINSLIDVMNGADAPEMATVVVPCKREEIASTPNLPKVVLTADDYALYFSRSEIPFLRVGGTDMPLYRHWGIYAYRRATLDRFVSLPESSLEKCEKLEQLRALENGIRIKVVKTEFQSIGIDTPEDLERAEQYIREHRIG